MSTTKNFKGFKVINKKNNNPEYILGTDWDQDLVVNVGYFTTITWDYARYIYGITNDEINKILSELR